MSVNESITAYSTTAANNTPQGTDSVGTDLDDHLRSIKSNVRSLSDIVSAFQAQTTFPADPADFVSTGTTFSFGAGISGGGSLQQGSAIAIDVAIAPLISATYTGTFLPTKIDRYGRSLEFTAQSSLTASKADVDSALSGYVTALSMRAAQGMAKLYATWDGSGTASTFMTYLVDSVTRSSAGTYVVRWGNTYGGAFTGQHYVALVDHELGISGNVLTVGSATRTTTSYKFKLVRTDTGAAQDCGFVGVAIFHIHYSDPNSTVP